MPCWCQGSKVTGWRQWKGRGTQSCTIASLKAQRLQPWGSGPASRARIMWKRNSCDIIKGLFLRITVCFHTHTISIPVCDYKLLLFKLFLRHESERDWTSRPIAQIWAKWSTKMWVMAPRARAELLFLMSQQNRTKKQRGRNSCNIIKALFQKIVRTLSENKRPERRKAEKLLTFSLLFTAGWHSRLWRSEGCARYIFSPAGACWWRCFPCSQLTLKAMQRVHQQLPPQHAQPAPTLP